MLKIKELYKNNMRTFQYRLYPTKSQQQKLWQHANKLNWLYNYFLNQKIESYKTEKKSISKNTQQGELVKLKEHDPILSEIHSQVLQQVAIRLDRSYQAFFRRIKNRDIAGFPKFRSCRDFFGICYPQRGFAIEEGIFNTKVYGKIEFKQHRKLQGNIKQVSISNKNNKWFLNVITDHIKENEKPKGKVGIDIGLKHLVVATDGMKIKNSTHAKHFDKQISRVQSERDKKQKGSNRWIFLNNVRQRLYDAKTRKLNDFQHKASRRLAQTYDTIFAEDLSVKKMSEGSWTSLNKSIRNAKLAQFLSFLEYKVNHLELVNPKNTSKMCNNCGKIHIDLKLSDRIIECRSCGIIYDRDENAAKNVLCLGQTILDGVCTRSDTIVEAFAFRQR
jgi:putative transposase